MPWSLAAGMDLDASCDSTLEPRGEPQIAVEAPSLCECAGGAQVS